MHRFLRREILALIGPGCICSYAAPTSGHRELGATPEAEQWLDLASGTKSLSSPLFLSRFVEPIYFLTDSFTWTPNPDNGPAYSTVVVPRGFVTDLASIPPIFFPLLRADGEYAQAAILHDYLYWAQTTTRLHADDIFRIAMRDLEVAPHIIWQLYNAVKVFGQSAWDDNEQLRLRGERRVLKRFPALAATRWSTWKLDPDVFGAM